MRLMLFIFTISIIGCSSANYNDRIETNSTDTNTLSKQQSISDSHFHKLAKLFCVGDFDGDKKSDTVFQHTYSKVHNLEIDSCPNNQNYKWEQVVDWFLKQQPDVYLTNNATPDTLDLGEGQGLYCLINIGDNNADGKDEIAVVKDNLDFSRLNSCKIFTLCDNKWTYLLNFEINESAFDFTTDTMPIFAEIKGFLERQNNRWVYSGYISNEDGIGEENGKMKSLDLKPCNGIR